ncbi:MAG: hypothetical protein CR993_02860 [Rhodobacterales bacterium]|nr:MAG: hypothetical protein CR993_02860 [Rhodobacterales bacterium]
MFLELIAVLVAGFAGAGVVMLLNRVLGGRLPRWLAPVVAAGAMIAATVSSEYGWYQRTADALPEGLEVVETIEKQAFYQPWTYLRPYVDRFMAVDVATLKRHDAAPDMVLADVYLFGRWAPVHAFPVLADCAGMRRAALTDAIDFEADGTVIGAEWFTAGAGDPMLDAICKTGGGDG